MEVVKLLVSGKRLKMCSLLKMALGLPDETLGGRSAEEGASRGHPFPTVCAMCSAIPVSIDWVCSQTPIACNIRHLQNTATQSACNRA